ncbi:transcriptional activator TenA homolog [Aeropyrum pernix K1]|uniref:Transcriptional activator TenA homolog n=1 Tax=Aeropyrum pernix (strain ATCC 700893 / DSM 11879 / JCM 9820 / NBRC 100138 / K1) TaxID=272557 RepID=Q9YEA4_AERPE|nr:thiaminase II [Aeropyrum pernix]BAA79642.2 transcriptional activator TenA homolog [Aeropyrum pernix K1]
MGESLLSDRLKRDNMDLWSLLPSHPFVKALYSGSLPLDKFRFYAVQDYNYLVGLVRSLSIAASKSWSFEVARLALSHASFLASTEMANYERLLGELGLSLSEVLREEPAPTNEAYVNFMIATCSTGTALECMVSLLPCYWSYREIAIANERLLRENSVDLYRRWASVYLSSEYGEAVEEYRRAVDRLWAEEGGVYSRLKRIFRKATRYEYMFWDMAWRMEKWPV